VTEIEFVIAILEERLTFLKAYRGRSIAASASELERIIKMLKNMR
jgi:hypothetical protein